MPPRLIPVDVQYVEIDADTVYEKYLRTCKLNGMEPMPRERAMASIAEISDTLSGRKPLPPEQH